MNLQCREMGCANYVYKCEEHLVHEQLALARVRVQSHEQLMSGVGWTIRIVSLAIGISLVRVVFHICEVW